MNENSLIERIETAVRARNIPEARKAIRLFQKTEDNTAANRAQIAEWYRRLGLYREGYLHVAPKEWKLPRPGSDPELTDTFLWTAYFLDLQGATGYATRLLDRLAPESLASLAIAGTIQMSNYAFENAVETFEKYFAKAKGPETYSQRMLRLAYADSLAGAKRFKEAHAVLGSVKAENGERFLSGILEQVRGEFAAMEGRHAEALTYLEKAVKLFPDGENTVDSGFLMKWMGVALAGLGRKSEAKKSFAQALKILDKPDHRPEILLDVYRCMNIAGLLDENLAMVLSAYPGLSPGFHAKLGTRSSSDWLGSKKAKLQIFPARNEWILDGKARLGIPLEILLLAYVRSAAPIGVSIERLKPLLWPDEVSAFLQIDGRITKILARLKSEYEMILKVENGRVIANETVVKNVAVEIGEVPRPWNFVEANREFEASTFAEYYGLGRTMAFKYLTNAVESGKLVKRSEGRRVLYSGST